MLTGGDWRLAWWRFDGDDLAEYIFKDAEEGSKPVMSYWEFNDQLSSLAEVNLSIRQAGLANQRPDMFAEILSQELMKVLNKH